MIENLQLRFRREKNGPEADLVNHFLQYYTQLFAKEGLEFAVLKEVYAEVGIPDILIVAWDGNISKTWKSERNNLNSSDVKILHHIAMNGKRGIRLIRIVTELGYSKKQTENSLTRLVIAELITFNGITARIVDLSSSFFLRKIISIEAKINDWKKAFSQARLNENFSSHSYVLMPEEKINNKILSSIEGNLGILAHDDQGPEFKVRAKKAKLPRSYFSWILNEYIGRQQALVS